MSAADRERRRATWHWWCVGLFFAAAILIPAAHVVVWQNHSQALALEHHGRTVTLSQRGDVRLSMFSTRGQAYVGSVAVRIDGSWRQVTDGEDDDAAYRFYDEGDVIAPPPHTKFAIPLTLRVGDDPADGILAESDYKAALRQAPGWGFWVADAVAVSVGSGMAVCLVRQGNRRMDEAAAILASARGAGETRTKPQESDDRV